MKKLLAVLLFALMLGSAMGQNSPIYDTNTFTTSGTSWTLTNRNGAMQLSFEYLLSGGPSTVSLVIQGCMNGNTCDTLDTYTTATNAIRSPALAKPYTRFIVTASWTGGTNVSIVVNTNATTATNGTGFAPFGTAGTCLVSNGPGVLPTWQACSGTSSTNFSALVANAPLASGSTYQIGNNTTLTVTGNGIINATSIDGTAVSLQGNGTKIQMFSGAAPTTGNVANYDASGNIKDSGTALTSLAPLASPTFTGTVTISGLMTGCLTNTAGVISSTGVACGSGGGGTPGGSTTQLQYNNAGSFGGIASATFSGGVLTLAGPTITAPLVNSFKDTNGNTILTLVPTTSGVDGLSITGAATANPATTTLSATGSDTNINLALNCKGTCVSQIGATAKGELDLGSIGINGSASGKVTIGVGSAAGTWTLQLPNTGGTNGFVLTTNGSGVTSWTAAGAGTVTSIIASPPLSGGTITTSGTIGCATCVTSAASLTNTAVLLGAALQASIASNMTYVSPTLSFPTGGGITSADTGTPAITFATNAIDVNQPIVFATTQLIATGTEGSDPSLPATGSWTIATETTNGLVGLSSAAAGSLKKYMVQVLSPVSNNFVTGIDATGTLSHAQPAFSNLSGSISPSQLASAVNNQTGTTYTVLSSDLAKLVTQSNSSSVATALPQATGSFGVGWYYFTENRGLGTVTITPTTSTIDGAATLALTTNQGVCIFSDGTNYFTGCRGMGSGGGTPGGSNTQVQINDTGSFYGDSGFTYNKTTKALALAGPLVIGTTPDQTFVKFDTKTMALQDTDTNANLTGTARPLSRTQCINVTPVTVAANTTSDQNLMTCSIDAGLLNLIGRTIRISSRGVYSTAAASTAQLTFKIKLCTVSGCGSGTVVTINTIQTAALAAVTAANDPWVVRGESITQTAGVTAVMETGGSLSLGVTGTLTAASVAYDYAPTGVTGSFDSTGATFLQITAAASAGSTSNSFTERSLIVEVLD